MALGMLLGDHRSVRLRPRLALEGRVERNAHGALEFVVRTASGPFGFQEPMALVYRSVLATALMEGPEDYYARMLSDALGAVHQHWAFCAPAIGEAGLLYYTREEGEATKRPSVSQDAPRPKRARRPAPPGQKRHYGLHFNIVTYPDFRAQPSSSPRATAARARRMREAPLADAQIAKDETLRCTRG